MKLDKRVVILAALSAPFLNSPALHGQSKSPVIEVVTLKLGTGVTPQDFQKVDQAMQATYMEKRPGFLSRESKPGKDGTWLAIVHWRSLADADASMKSFSTAGGTAKWMSEIAPGSMVMNRYGW